MSTAYLFDSHALLAFFQGEKGSGMVADLLTKTTKESLTRLISVINLGEILYLVKRRFDDEKKIEVLGRIHQLGFTILPVPDALVYQAAEIKAAYPLSYADCFAVASAMQHAAVLVTGDPEFNTVAHLVTIAWIRQENKNR